MNIATVDNLPAQSNMAVSSAWRIAQGVIRAAAVIIALVPAMATLLAIPVLGEWPSAAAICIIALGGSLAATSSNQGDKKGESQ
jgi:hypothetical protein